MLKIGITGGIGSGKSLVSKMFKLLHIPIFDADAAAKYLMENDSSLKYSLQETFGNDIFKNDRLDRSFLASIVFNNSEKLKQLNSIVHPATIAFGKKWMTQQNAPYILKEAALFFETGSNLEMDIIIGVYAPKEIRLERTVKRDRISENEVLLRMDKQMDEEEKMNKCDFIIYNNDKQSVIQQVLNLHQHLLKISIKKNMALSLDSKTLLNLDGLENLKGKTVGIVATEWNDNIVTEQINGALKIADQLDIKTEILYVPGSVELTFGIKKFQQIHNPDAVIAFGAVIKGGTPHFEYVCKFVTEGVLALNLLLDIPVIFGVLTLDNEQQAWERLGGPHGHKGEEAMIAALKMMKI